MKSKSLLREYLQGNTQTMQLATVSDGKPWIATVYFVADDDLNVYWLSWPERRHSREGALNASVAATIVVKPDQPVIGVQMSGEMYEVKDMITVTHVMENYVAKYTTGMDFTANFAKGTNRHVMYKLSPHTIQLFDEVVFPDKSPVQVKL